MNSSDFFRAHWSRHLCCKALVDRQACIQPTTPSIYIEGTSSLVTLSPTLMDPALVSVVRAVDGQDTGLSAQPAEQPTSDRHQDFHLQRALVQASLLLSISRPASSKERDLWRHIQSANRLSFRLITKQVTCFHRPGRSEVRSFRTHVYCDSSPYFTDPTLLSVVGFCRL